MFGDQNLFCRRSDFKRVGGYNSEIPIMEDLDLLMRLHKEGPCTSSAASQADPEASTLTTETLDDLSQVRQLGSNARRDDQTSPQGTSMPAGPPSLPLNDRLPQRWMQNLGPVGMSSQVGVLCYAV